MTDFALLFPRDYAEARSRFTVLADAAGFSRISHVHPSARGPLGEELVCDVAWRGPTDPDTLLLINSGTHGVEGFCGSGCQAALLTDAVLDTLPPTTAVLLVHAINPYGFAWLRRTNEDNVDLNRNFVAFDDAKANPAYDEIHGWLIPEDWDGPARAEADTSIARFIESRGARSFQSALSTGQYQHPDGLFYGGREPSWSNRVWRSILSAHCMRARTVIGVDLHTGLGPCGIGEAICVTDEAEFRRARALFGEDVTWTGGADSVSARVTGSLVHAAHEELGQGRLTMIGLEYGTHPIDVTLEALRAEAWLSARGHLDTAQGRAIKQALRDAFFVDEPEWKRAVVRRFFDLVKRSAGSVA